MARTVGINQLGEVINRELTVYSTNVSEGIKKQTKSSMTKMVKQTKLQQFKEDTGSYRKSISQRTTFESSYGITREWYVKSPDSSLSHLLEHGHALRDGGRFAGYGFIGKAKNMVEEEYLKKIEEVIANG